MAKDKVLILPGLQGSRHSQWQSIWADKHAYQVLEQHDWTRPLRGDWLVRLEDVISHLTEPTYLVAQGLACIQVAAWAVFSAHAAKVKGAFLVAPVDVEAPHWAHALSSWRPVEMKVLPFRSVLIGAPNDPDCSPERAKAFADAWGSASKEAAMIDQVSAESNVGEWSWGHALFKEMMKENQNGH
jgi:hypothetical protein